MTAIRKRTKTKSEYHAFLVKPTADFCPSNWQEKPESYQIIEYLGPRQRLGRVDAWRFMHNHDAITQGTAQDGWAIYVR
jgi:hypothetical protein